MPFTIALLSWRNPLLIWRRGGNRLWQPARKSTSSQPARQEEGSNPIRATIPAVSDEPRT